MSRVRSVLLCLLAFGSAHCATAPYSGQPTSDYDIEVAGFTNEPSATVWVAGWDWPGAKWQWVNSTTSASSPTFAAGTLCSNSPDLYAFSTTTRLEWPFYWRNVSGVNQAKVKAHQYGAAGNQPIYFASGPGATSCMISNITPGCSFGDVAYNICGFNKLDAQVIDSTGHLPFP